MFIINGVYKFVGKCPKCDESLKEVGIWIPNKPITFKCGCGVEVYAHVNVSFSTDYDPDPLPDVPYINPMADEVGDTLVYGETEEGEPQVITTVNPDGSKTNVLPIAKTWQKGLERAARFNSTGSEGVKTANQCTSCYIESSKIRDYKGSAICDHCFNKKKYPFTRYKAMTAAKRAFITNYPSSDKVKGRIVFCSENSYTIELQDPTLSHLGWIRVFSHAYYYDCTVIVRSDGENDNYPEFYECDTYSLK